MLGLSISSAAGQVGQMQVRGKKKNPKARTQVNVKLIKDLPGYGRKGIYSKLNWPFELNIC